MTIEQTGEPAGTGRLRLWPGFVIVLLQWLVRFGLPIVEPGVTTYALLGGLLGGLAVVVWWAFFSLAPRSERWGGAALMVIALAATPLVLHESIATAMMRLMFPIYAVPVLSLAFVLWAAVSRRLPAGTRRATMAAIIVLSCAVWALFRTSGVAGDGTAEFSWRWTETAEERLVAGQVEELPALSPAPAVAETAPAWPGFRGPDRNSIIPGVRIETDWSTSPPVEVWRRPVGPGWSSFAVQGDFIYTQEQRADDEIVSCYRAATGEPVWRHRDPARFWEANAGPGPRATPALSNGRVYTFGATGIVNALDLKDGSVVWSRNAAADTGAEVPTWGFSSSPLVLDGVVIVHAGALAAYDAATGDPRWSGPAAGGSYSSPHLLTIGGVAQIVMLNVAGAAGVAPADGALLWEHSWKGFPIVQPALTADGDILFSAGDLSGLRRITVAKGSGGWTTEERWTTNRLKPYFNDFVVHEGHAYGFDGSILACIGLSGGQRRWKGGRYGNGQLVLLPDQDLLLITTEDGELTLVPATPDRHTELARFPAIEGKTWNHPVLTGNLLLVRNDQEMAAFRLP